MTVHCIGAVARAFIFALSIVACSAQAQAQRAPSANAVALAKEILIAKGAGALYDPAIPNLLDRARGIFLQQNPMLSRDLNDVAARLRTELAPRTMELIDDAAKLYAARFTEPELKDVLAFYKSPVGKKVVAEEPAILDESVKNGDVWVKKMGEEILAKFRTEMKKKGHDL